MKANSILKALALFVLLPASPAMATPDADAYPTATLTTTKASGQCIDNSYNRNRPICTISLKRKSRLSLIGRGLFGPLDFNGNPVAENNELSYFRGDSGCTAESAREHMSKKHSYKYRNGDLPGYDALYHDLAEVYEFVSVKEGKHPAPAAPTRENSFPADEKVLSCLKLQQGELNAALEEIGIEALKSVVAEKRLKHTASWVAESKYGYQCPVAIQLDDNREAEGANTEKPALSHAKDLGEAATEGRVLKLRPALELSGTCRVVDRASIKREMQSKTDMAGKVDMITRYLGIDASGTTDDTTSGGQINGKAN